MNKQGFLNLLKDPNNISETDLLGLEEIIANFPFCQTAQILAAKGASDHGQMLSEKQVRIAAAYTSERKNLKRILSPSTSKESPIPTPIKKESFEKVKEPKQIEASNEAPITTIKEELNSQQPEINAKEPVSVNENKKPALSNENFFEELEKNLQKLHSLKENAANISTPKEVKEDKKPSILNIEKPSEPPVKEISIENINDILIPESIKTHTGNSNIFSSRLDDVIGENENRIGKPNIGSEAEVLLNYLSFLEKNKNYPKKDKKKTDSIIDKFIKTDPSISKMDKKSLPEQVEDKASQSYSLKGGLISENMANIYVLQGKKSKAIEIYEQLILKNPEKRAYFVSKIENLK